jgi:dinuclear metal center YbgI/SA1388 family protein
MERIAPQHLKESYDNVGLMVGDMNSQVTSILMALDCTMDVINEAQFRGCNLIITHHPLLFIKPSSITTGTLQGRKIIELIKKDINLYSSHTNLDIASGGLNDMVTEILGFKQWDIIEASGFTSGAEELGVGRLVTLEKPWTLERLCSHVKTYLNIDCLRYCGDENSSISRIAIINGSGEDYFKAAKAKGAQCIITGDTSYHYASDYSEEGVAVIDAGHFETEWPPMRIFAERLQNALKESNFDNKIYISEAAKPVYKYI